GEGHDRDENDRAENTKLIDPIAERFGIERLREAKRAAERDVGYGDDHDTQAEGDEYPTAKEEGDGIVAECERFDGVCGLVRHPGEKCAPRALVRRRLPSGCLPA